jgi:ADP-heptose:LPS heptosyltransferase
MRRVLVVRNDKIGDFMLAWPAFALLKAAGCHVTALVPSYTAPLAKMCPSIDNIIIDPGRDSRYADQLLLVGEIVDAKFDAAIAFFSNWRNAVLLRHVKIPYRLAPATKIAQFLYTHRLTQRRSRSEKPEWEYNLDLAAEFLKDQGLPLTTGRAPYLEVTAERKDAARLKISESLAIDATVAWMMVHVGSGGSANNLSLHQYESLIVDLVKQFPKSELILSAGPAEESTVADLVAHLAAQRVRVVMFCPSDGLPALVEGISNAACFIAGSTGPLHIAGALDVPTVGFYTRRRSATALRWQTLNTPSRHLAFSVPEHSQNPEDFSQIDLKAVVRRLSNWLPEPSNPNPRVR